MIKDSIHLVRVRFQSRKDGGRVREDGYDGRDEEFVDGWEGGHRSEHVYRWVVEREGDFFVCFAELSGEWGMFDLVEKFEGEGRGIGDRDGDGRELTAVMKGVPSSRSLLPPGRAV